MRINSTYKALTKLIAFSLVLPLTILVAGAPKSESALLSATATRTTLINPAGGNDAGWSSCPADNAVVGFRWSGSTAASAPYSIYCRALNADGTISSDSNTTSNSTSVVVYNGAGAANVEWCPGGTVATGVRHRGWADFALVCNTPPGLGSAPTYSATVTTPTDNLCAASSVLIGMGKYTGAWLDSLYGMCKVFGSATLSYNVNTGSGTAPSSVTLLIINNPTTTSSSYSGTKSGFTFAGWNTLATGIGTHYDAGASISVSVATTLYAQWNSTITYDANEATSGTVPSPTTATGTSANTTLATNSGTLARTGYTFAGWNTAANGSGTNYAAGLTTYTSSGNTTLYAQWNSTITYNGNGNTGGSVPTATTAKGSAANTTLANAGTMTRTGYTFAGWNTAADASGIAYASGLTTYQSTGNITLYAKWTRTITYNVNGAASGVPSRSTDVFTNATTPTISTFPTVNSMVRTGYTFAGWVSTAAGTTLLTAPYSTTSEATLYARWTANTYSVIYDTSTVTSGTMADTSFTAGTAFSLRANTFARTGYIFKNWNTDSSGTGTTYTNSQSVTLYAAITLYPQWNLLAPGVPTVSTSPGNTEVTVTPTAAASSSSVGPPSSFTITAYTSAGVLLSPSKTCTVVSPATSCLITGLTNGTTYQFAATATNSTATSASSVKVNSTPSGIFVKFDATTNGGTTSTTSATYNKPTAITLPSASKSGYVFSGWYTTASSGGTFVGAAGSTYIPSSVGIYYPVGPQLNVPLSTLTNAGWTRCYSDLYSQAINVNADANSINSKCTGQFLIFAAGVIGTANDSTSLNSNNIYILAAGERSSILSATTLNTPRLNNGTYWFYTSGTSLGFDDDSSISQGQCFQDSYALCWHWVGSNGGYSAHDVVVGNANTGWVRHVYQTDGLVLYARFTGIVYTINYNGNGNTGGTVPSQGTYETGGTAHTIGAGPTKTGYTFSNWYTNTSGSGGTAYSAGASYSSQADLNLYANWTPAARTVTYALNGGTSSADTTTLTGKVIGNTVVLPASSTMTKTGYSFTGWSDGTTTYAGGATWTVPASDSNFTITAQWSPLTLSYRYDLNGGTGTTPASGTKNYNESLTLAASTGLAKSGYIFGGWNDGSTTRNANDTFTVTSNIILVAQWSALSYSITYDGNGSTSGSTSSGSYTAGGVPYAIAANGFAKSGYNFAGWNTLAGGTGTPYVVGAGYSTASALTLYAQWSAATYTVTYNANGGSGSAPSAGSFVSGSAFTVSTNSGSLAKTGYTFAGWNTAADGSGTDVAVSATDFTTTSNVTLYAKWSATQFTVTYALNDGSGTVPTQSNKTLSSTFAVASGSTLTPPPNSGAISYSFAYWNDGNNNYRAGESYRMPAANVVLTAQWIAIYKVTYNGNGGNTSIAAVQLADGDNITVGVAATRDGYTFVKWQDQSNGLWSPGETTTVTSGRYIFSANWQVINRTLSFSLDSGTGSAPADITGKIIGEIVALPTTNSTKTGYTFGGWSNGGTTYPAGSNFTVGNGDAPFVAVWIQNTNSIVYNGNGATGGTVPASGSYVTGSTPGYTVSSNSGTLVKTGFTFAGWYTTATGSGGTAYAENASGLTTDVNITLYAKWDSASYAVTYSTNGGSSAPTQSDTAYGSTFTLPAAPTKAGFTFLGWQLNSNNYAAGSTFTMGSTAITFTAQWSGVYFAITYALNGGSGTTPTQDDVASGGSFTTAAAPTKNGFTFTGWSDGVTTTNASTSITNLSENKTLTAQWAIAAPGIPGTPTAVPSNGGATITIVAPSTGGTPSSYTVTASPGGATCTVTTPGTSCTISSLTNGTAYTFTSTATNSAGSSASSSSASSAVTPASVPSEPISVSGSGTGGSALIEWSTPSSNGGSAITDYIVEYSVDGSNTWNTFSDGVSTTTSATVTGLTAGSSYIFRVTAKNVIGNSLPSISTPVISTLPTAPAVPVPTAGNGQVSVSWSAPSHLGSGTLTGDEYEVIAYDSAGTVAGTCKPTSGQTTCTVTGLTNGSAYTFKVKAITTAGESSLSSASSSVTPATVPNAPSGVQATISGSSIIVTFTAPTDNGGAAITSYAITSSPVAPVGATCSVGANSTTYNCSGLTAGTNYTFTVKATNSVGQSQASLSSTAVTAIGAPTSPQNVSAVITAGSTTLSATVSFDAPSSNNGSPITSYTVTASPGGATCTVAAPTTYCDISVLPDQVYTFTATATNAAGTSAASSASLATTATNGLAPTLVVDPIVAPTGNLIENQTLSSNVSVSSYNSTPNSVITYQWKRCTDPLDESTCTDISGATSSTYTLTSSDVDKYIRVQATATNSIGTSTNLSNATEVIAAAPTSSSSSSSSSSSTTTSSPTESTSSAAPSCDSTCQATKDAAAAKAVADAAAKAAADAAAEASVKAAKDAAILAAAKQDISVQQALANQAAQAAAKAQAAQAAAAKQAAAAQAAALAAAQKAAVLAAAAAKTPTSNTSTGKAAIATAQAQATALAQQAAAAVKSAATAAATAVAAVAAATAAQSQLAIQITNVKVSTSVASASATAAKAAVATATAQQAAAKVAQTNAAQVAAAAKIAASKAAADLANAAAAKAASDAAAAKAASDAVAQQKAAEKAANEKAIADKAAVDAANKLVEAAQAAAKAAETLTKATTADEKTAAQTALENAKSEVTKAQSAVDVASQVVETKAVALEKAEQVAEKALDQADSKNEEAAKAAENLAVKQATVEVSKEVIAAVAQQVAVAKVAVTTATANVAAAVAVAAKVTASTSSTSSKGKAATTAKVNINNLKPGQRIKVTVNKK